MKIGKTILQLKDSVKLTIRLPLYMQVYCRILSSIRGGEWRPEFGNYHIFGGRSTYEMVKYDRGRTPHTEEQSPQD